MSLSAVPLWLLILLLAARAEATPRGTAASAPHPRLILTNTGALPERMSRDAAGPLPADGKNLEEWAKGAIARITETYQVLLYPYVRAWYRIDPDQTVRIFVDEGRVRVGFTGAGSVQGFLLRQSLNLPHGVVHEPTLKLALDNIKQGYDLLNIYYRLKEPGEIEVTPLGDAVPVRVLQIYVVSREDYGWFFDIGFSPVWGILPGLAYQRKLFWSGDRFRGKVELGFPFRQYLFEENPSFQWVHGGIQLSYQTPRFWQRRLAPRFEELFYVSHLDRGDLQIKSYYRIRNTSLPSMVLFLPPFEISLGVGADVFRVFNVALVTCPPPPATTPCTPPDPGSLHLDNEISVRVLQRTRVRLEPSSEAMRRDQRHFAELRFDIASSGTQSWLIDSEISAQLFFLYKRHRFIIRPHGVFLAGDVRFWDEVQLAGDWQRVWFNNRYWVRTAAQLELGYRVNVWRDWVDVGFFHDFSVFGDRSHPEEASTQAAVVDAFGPSLHLLLFDTFALDVYVAFGFGREGFDHGISFSVNTTF